MLVKQYDPVVRDMLKLCAKWSPPYVNVSVFTDVNPPTLGAQNQEVRVCDDPLPNRCRLPLPNILNR